MPTTITTEQVKALRDQTGISIMQCKKALEEAKGRHGKGLGHFAQEIWRSLVLKKGRPHLQGRHHRWLYARYRPCRCHGRASVGERFCFRVVMNSRQLARDIAMHVAATNPKFIRKSDIKESDMKAAKVCFRRRGQRQPGHYAGKDPRRQARRLFRRDGSP